LEEAVDEPSNLARSLEKSVSLKFIEKPLSMRNNDHGLDFAERPLGNAEMTAECLSPISTPALGDICRDGNRRAPDLRREPVYLGLGPLLRLTVNQ
jgi:hypothetical protein